MRIFQILEFNQFNTGSVHQMFQAASGLRARGHEVTIVSRPSEELRRRAEESGVDVIALPLRHQVDLISIRDLSRAVRARRPDVIHVHKGIAHAIALAATWRQPAAAFVVNRGVSFPLDIWNRAKYRTSRVDRVVTVCQQIREVIVESGKLPRDKVVVVYAGTDVTQFDPERADARAFRVEKKIGEDRFLIAQVGVRDWKGWKELVDAVAELAPSHPAFHLAFIGIRTDDESREVMRYAHERGIGERITAVEVRRDMPDVFAACDLVVDASWAGTGITGTIREAMSMRKPVIATDAGGNRELVSSSDVGWLIPARDHDALVSAIREVTDDRDRASTVARNAREHVVNGFSKELRITRLEGLYGEILVSKR